MKTSMKTPRLSKIALAVSSLALLGLNLQAQELRMDNQMGQRWLSNSENSPSIAPQGSALALKSAQFLGEATRATMTTTPGDTPSRLWVDLDRARASADGKSRIEVTVRIHDANGEPLLGPRTATVTLSGNARLLLPAQQDDALAPQLQKAPQGRSALQLNFVNGVARLTVLAPSVPEEALLRVRVEDEIAEGVISFVPELRDFVAVGLVEGILMRRNLPSNALQGIGSRDGFEEELRRWSSQSGDGDSANARAAMFLKGTVRGDLLLTAAYDSDKITRSRLLRDIDPELEYPIYGDASLRGFDARSSSPLYVRIDKERSYVLWGDFITGDGASQMNGYGQTAPLAKRSLGAYNRTATGLRLHSDTPGLLANAFVTYDSLRNRTEQYPLNGTSILPGLGSSDAVVNSEQISIITYDRNLLGTVLSQRVLERFKDYVFEPFNGRVRLLGSDLNFLDEQGNPRYLRLSYEVDNGGGEKFYTYGADGQYAVSEKFEIGGSAVKDENPASPYQLLSANASVQWGPRSNAVVEVAHSDALGLLQPDGRFTPVNGATTAGALGQRQDDAVRIGLQHEGDGWTARLQAQKAGAAFANPTIDAAAGKTDLRGSATARLSESLSLLAEGTHLQDDVQAGKPARDDLSLGLALRMSERLSLRLGVRQVREDAALASTPMLPPNYGSGYGSGNENSISTLSNGLTTPVPMSHDVDATTLRAGLDWKATKQWQLSAEAEAGNDRITNAQVSRWMLGSDYRFNDSLRGVVRYERADGLGSAMSLNQGDKSEVLSAGLRADVGTQTQVYSEYRLRDAASGETLAARDMQLASGIRRGVAIAPGVQLSGNAEYLKIFEGDGREAYALGVGLDHTGNALWKLSTRFDWRHIMDSAAMPGDQSEDQYAWTISFAHKLNRDWTYLVRNYLLYSDYRADTLGNPRGDTLQNRFQMGFAWRPVDDNRWNALARYEYRTSWDDSIAPLAPGDTAALGVGDHYRAHILSLVGDYHPSRPWWLTGRLAAMAREDRIPETGATDSFNAYLVGARLTYDYSKRWDISGLASQLYAQQGGNTQTALGAELGYLIQPNLRIGLGYNATGFTAPELSGADYTQQGWFLRLSFKFDEKLFKGNDPEVNRSLPRPQ